MLLLVGGVVMFDLQEKRISCSNRRRRGFSLSPAGSKRLICPFQPGSRGTGGKKGSAYFGAKDRDDRASVTFDWVRDPKVWVDV